MVVCICNNYLVTSSRVYSPMMHRWQTLALWYEVSEVAINVWCFWREYWTALFISIVQSILMLLLHQKICCSSRIIPANIWPVLLKKFRYSQIYFPLNMLEIWLDDIWLIQYLAYCVKRCRIFYIAGWYESAVHSWGHRPVLTVKEDIHCINIRSKYYLYSPYFKICIDICDHLL